MLGTAQTHRVLVHCVVYCDCVSGWSIVTEREEKGEVKFLPPRHPPPPPPVAVHVIPSTHAQLASVQSHRFCSSLLETRHILHNIYTFFVCFDRFVVVVLFVRCVCMCVFCFVFLNARSRLLDLRFSVQPFRQFSFGQSRR